MSVKLLTEHHLEFLSLKGGCTGSSKSTLVKMPHCWKSHVMAHFSFTCFSARELELEDRQGRLQQQLRDSMSTEGR